MSTTDITPELQALPDEEKQQIPSPNSENHFLVEWDEESDSLNPKNFHTAWKWLIVTIASIGSLLV